MSTGAEDGVQSPASIRVEENGPVRLLTLNRPDRMNAWSDALEAEYFAFLDEAEADPAVRAVVLTGEGRAFCVGVDFDDVKDLDPDAAARAAVERPRPRYRPWQFRKPLIAAINGAAAGLGLVEALYCDVRFSTPTAKLTTSFTRRGLIAEFGAVWLLQRALGSGAATDLLLSGRVVTGEEGNALGLVDHVAEPDQLLEAALAYAADLAENCSPTSIAVIKEQLRTEPDLEFAAAFERSQGHLRDSLGRADVAEGVSSFLERRAPDFPPLALGG